ncbi:MAG: DUF3228 family protein [Myxococcota bacterium]
MITTPKDAVAHLYGFHSSKAAMQAELDRLVEAKELQVSSNDLVQICSVLQLSAPTVKQAEKAGALTYGKQGGFAATESKAAAGSAGAQLMVSGLNRGESIAMSDFAVERNKPGTGYSYFLGTQAELLDLIKEHWDQRLPGTGRSDLNEVISIPVPAARFMTTTVAIDDKTPLQAAFYRRRAHEDPYVRVTTDREPEPAKFANIILYSKDTLGKNGERSTKADWEVVTIIASPVQNEPMDPVTMMRNMLGKAGGTIVHYTPEQFAEAIDFWSRHVKVMPK